MRDSKPLINQSFSHFFLFSFSFLFLFLTSSIGNLVTSDGNTEVKGVVKIPYMGDENDFDDFEVLFLFFFLFCLFVCLFCFVVFCCVLLFLLFLFVLFLFLFCFLFFLFDRSIDCSFSSFF